MRVFVRKEGLILVVYCFGIKLIFLIILLIIIFGCSFIIFFFLVRLSIVLCQGQILLREFSIKLVRMARVRLWQCLNVQDNIWEKVVRFNRQFVLKMFRIIRFFGVSVLSVFLMVGIIMVYIFISRRMKLLEIFGRMSVEMVIIFDINISFKWVLFFEGLVMVIMQVISVLIIRLIILVVF